MGGYVKVLRHFSKDIVDALLEGSVVRCERTGGKEFVFVG